jgi:hypothetical protein
MNPMSNSICAAGPSSAKHCDTDQPYVFGRHPSVSTPFPFTPLEFAQLLVLRGRVQDGIVREDDR